MAYAQPRSCNDSLREGYFDGAFKHYRPNTAGKIEDCTANIRKQMSGVWHGFNELDIKHMPDGTPVNTPYFVSVTPQDDENV